MSGGLIAVFAVAAVFAASGESRCGVSRDKRVQDNDKNCRALVTMLCLPRCIVGRWLLLAARIVVVSRVVLKNFLALPRFAMDPRGLSSGRQFGQTPEPRIPAMDCSYRCAFFS